MINYDKQFSFIEFRSHDECTNALQFDGFAWHGQVCKSSCERYSVTLRLQPLKVRRPRDFMPLIGLKVEKTTPEGDLVYESPFKLFIGCIPEILSEEKVSA